MKSGWRLMDRLRDCDSEWELLSQNGFLDLILIIASFITISQLIKACFQIILAIKMIVVKSLKPSKASFSIDSDLDFKSGILLWIFEGILGRYKMIGQVKLAVYMTVSWVLCSFLK